MSDETIRTANEFLPNETAELSDTALNEVAGGFTRIGRKIKVDTCPVCGATLLLVPGMDEFCSSCGSPLYF